MKWILKATGSEDVVSFKVLVVEEIEKDSKTGKAKLIIPFKGEQIGKRIF